MFRGSGVGEVGDEVDMGTLQRGESVQERANRGGEVRLALPLDSHDANAYCGRDRGEREDGSGVRSVLGEEVQGLGFAVEGIDRLVGGRVEEVGGRVAGEEEATVEDGEREAGEEAEQDPEGLGCKCLHRRTRAARLDQRWDGGRGEFAGPRALLSQQVCEY